VTLQWQVLVVITIDYTGSSVYMANIFSLQRPSFVLAGIAVLPAIPVFLESGVMHCTSVYFSNC